MSQPLRVLLVEDDWAVRHAVRDYLVRHEMIVEEADCLDAALVTATASQPDVAVIDIVLPRRAGERADFNKHTGVEVARQLRQELPQLGIVFLSAYVDRGPEVVQLFMEGHDRIVYLLKGSKPQELMDAIQHSFARGLSTLEIGPGVQFKRKNAFDLAVGNPQRRRAARRGCCFRSRLETLSEPEKRVFEAIGACRTHKQAAEQLGISARTIGSHVDAIYEKLGLREAHSGLNPLMLLAKLGMLENGFGRHVSALLDISLWPAAAGLAHRYAGRVVGRPWRGDSISSVFGTAFCRLCYVVAKGTQPVHGFLCHTRPLARHGCRPAVQ